MNAPRNNLREQETHRLSTTPLITLLSVAILLAGLFYLREIRLRRGLQRLLVQLLSRWRTARDPDKNRRPDAAGDSGDDDPADLGL
jgi:hypothetical protein